jgi:hypothetical protein
MGTGESSMSGNPKPSDFNDLIGWAHDLMDERKPDFVIGDHYLHRWWVVPRNEKSNVYLHEILHSDDDRAMHDHPWDNTTIVLEGSYEEHTPSSVFQRAAGDVVRRKATETHRLVIPDGGRALTLFLTGPVERVWGFHCPKGFVPWYDFVDADDKGSVGRGCGEYA